MKRLVQCYAVLFMVYFAPNINAQVFCTAKDGRGIVACVEAAHKDRLVAGVSLEVRETNAIFLREQVIKTARCAGLDVSRNLKRGGPEISVDFVAWKHDGLTEGVDIIGSWDDLTKPLSLSWHRYTKAQSYGFPTYQPYGQAVNCLGEPEPVPVPPVQDSELFKKIEQLEAALADARTQIAALVTQIGQLHSRFENVESDIPQIQSRVFTLEQIDHPKAYKCSAKLFGLPVSCSVTAEVNP